MLFPGVEEPPSLSRDCDVATVTVPLLSNMLSNGHASQLRGLSAGTSSKGSYSGLLLDSAHTNTHAGIHMQAYTPQTHGTHRHLHTHPYMYTSMHVYTQCIQAVHNVQAHTQRQLLKRSWKWSPGLLLLAKQCSQSPGVWRLGSCEANDLFIHSAAAPHFQGGASDTSLP